MQQDLPSQPRFSGLLAVFFILAFALPSAALASLAEQRKTFVEAEKALRSGPGPEYQSLKARLGNYPLVAYLEFEEARLGSIQTFEDYLNKYPTSLKAKDLRRIWLKRWANKKEWRNFLRYYREDQATQTVQCLHLQALIATGSKSHAYQLAPKVWAYGGSLPDACDAPFKRMIKDGKLTPEMVWARMDRLRDKPSKENIRLMTYLKKLLPKSEYGHHNLWMLSLKRPDKVFSSSLLKQSHVSRGDLVAHSLGKLAWRNPSAALTAWGKTKAWMNPAQLKRVEYSLGRVLSRKNHAGATRFFDSIQHCEQHSELCELMINQAARRQNWRKLLTWVNRMPQSQQEDEEIGYWKGRALEALGQKTAAMVQFRKVAQDRSYAGFMAADRANVLYRLAHRPVSAADVRLAASTPSMQYARELYFLGRPDESAREISWTGRTAPNDAIKRGAASMVKQWGWTNRAIHALLRSHYWDDLEIRFPLDYRQHVMEEARKNDIDPAWIFAILRQESMFNKDARSPVGALGLMQLMPATARVVARKLGMKKPSTTDILQPGINIRLGSHYLKMLSDQFHGQQALAIPSYNAGPSRTQAWMRHSAPIDVWIENIPFDETRLYVKRVLSYWILYDYRLGNKNPKRLRDRIPAYVSPALIGKTSPKAASKSSKKKSKGINPILQF